MFTDNFGRYVCEGDNINCTIDGIDYEARLEHDHSTTPTDFDDVDQAVIDAWNRDEWRYFGVVISAAKNGVLLTSHAASLWGIEGNLSFGDAENVNGYFREVANELLPEAIHEAEATLADIREKLA